MEEWMEDRVGAGAWHSGPVAMEAELKLKWRKRMLRITFKKINKVHRKGRRKRRPATVEATSTEWSTILQWPKRKFIHIV